MEGEAIVSIIQSVRAAKGNSVYSKGALREILFTLYKQGFLTKAQFFRALSLVGRFYFLLHYAKETYVEKKGTHQSYAAHQQNLTSFIHLCGFIMAEGFADWDVDGDGTLLHWKSRGGLPNSGSSKDPNKQPGGNPGD